jgi:hypothetical protein
MPDDNQLQVCLAFAKEWVSLLEHGAEKEEADVCAMHLYCALKEYLRKSGNLYERD